MNFLIKKPQKELKKYNHNWLHFGATIGCIFYGRSKNPGTRTILDICQALEITLFDFFNDPVLKDIEFEGSY